MRIARIGTIAASIQNAIPITPETQAFLDATGITDPTLIIAYDRAIRDLLGESNPNYPTENIFNEAIFYMFASDGINQSHAFQQKFNMCDPGSNQINFVNDVSLNHTSDGWLQSGTNYGDSGIKPSVYFASNRSASGCYQRNNASIGQYLLGCFDGVANEYRLSPARFGPNSDNLQTSLGHCSYNGGAGFAFSALLASFSGTMSGARYSATDHRISHNKFNVFGNTTMGGTAPSLNIFIGCLNIAGSPSNFSGANYQGLWFLKNPTPSKVLLCENILNSFNAAIGRGKKPTVVFFGDSITVGRDASPVSNSWVNKLVTARNWEGINHGVSGSLMQNTGGTANNMQDRSVNMLPIRDTNCDYLVIAYGVNDFLSTNPACTKATFKAAYQEVIDRAVDRFWPENRIVLVTPFYSDIGSVQTRMQEHVAAVLELASENDTLLYDANAAMISGGGSSLLTDGIHPNNAGHDLIFNGINAIIP